MNFERSQDGLLSASELGLSDANNDAPILEERQERRPGVTAFYTKNHGKMEVLMGKP